MHSGDPKEKKKKTGITSFSSDVLGLRVPDDSNCQLPRKTPYANEHIVDGNRNIPRNWSGSKFFNFMNEEEKEKKRK